MMEMNIRSAVPDFDAFMLGLDFEELIEERFSGEKHRELLRVHAKRLEKWAQIQRVEEFDGRLGLLGHQYRQREKLRRERISAKKQREEYDFPDEILQIALRSIDAQGSV